MFYKIMALNEDSQQANIFGLLIFCLASIIHHSDIIKLMIQLHPGHPLYKVPVLSDDNIWSKLKPLVTTHPSEIMGN